VSDERRECLIYGADGYGTRLQRASSAKSSTLTQTFLSPILIREAEILVRSEKQVPARRSRAWLSRAGLAPEMTTRRGLS
jgi:hypothetical protein